MEPSPSTAAGNAKWKLRASTTKQKIQHVLFDKASQFFAVDASGSTSGTIIRHEKDFTEGVHAGHSNDRVAIWGTDCEDPTQNFSRVRWKGDMGGTEPSSILKNPAALKAIESSDLWYLLTDGEIWGNDVEVLSRLAIDKGILNVPAIFVITGRKQPTPSELNVSVGITFFANSSDVLILFKEIPSGDIYILAGKGCFAALASNRDNNDPDLSSWTPLKKLSSETRFIELCRDHDIQIPAAESRPKLLSGSIKLGKQWEQQNDGMSVDLDALLAGGSLNDADLEQILSEEAFNNLAVACKTRGRIQDLRSLLLGQKTEELNVKLEDVSGAADIVSRLSDPDIDITRRNMLQQQLREAHLKNRRHYQATLKNINESGQEQAIRKRNRLVNHSLEQLAEIESSTYTADILSRRSNRARRAAAVPEGGAISINSLDIDTPTAFRGECRVCCGEEEVMSIAIKSGADWAANTDNFALDFPLAAGQFESNTDLIASQTACFQCALAFNGKTMYREDLAAVLPTLDYTGSNKKYIQEQLYIALTGGLRTGASGVSQLFMTILGRTLRHKAWAGARASQQGNSASHTGHEDPDPEVVLRQSMLSWVIQNMLENTGCRETFNEQGEWVTYREALAWAAKDFRSQGVDSWAIGYPTTGFMQLLRFGRQLDAFDDQTICDLRLAKVLHSVASAHLALLLKHGPHGEQNWKQPLLETIYTRFNAPMIPVDLQDASSIVTSRHKFWERLAAVLTAEPELLADWFVDDQKRAMYRIQLLAFWLIYHQREHTRAKTFFQTLRDTQPLSLSVLNPTGPAPSPAVTNPILLSIFRGPPTDQAFHARHTGPAPFTTPFGPSVLHCCFAACAEPFIAISEFPMDKPWTEKQRDGLRQARAKHLIKAFGVDKTFEQAQTGMPVVTTTPAPPSSTHINLHVSVARVWSRIDVAERRDIARAVMSGDKGDDAATNNLVDTVVKEICETGRGDIFQEGLERFIVEVLPSFLQALQKALQMQGKGGDADVVEFEHVWTENNLEAKARYEMSLR
ncbi:MAG: hypothetical protein Q9227_003914 [Pyrenula ochraceoflavens]